MRFDQLDLNLLVALDALLESRNVSKSANKLRLSQPAVSNALSRLRSFFNDDLLVQVGREMCLTARAEQLFPRVRETLLQIRTTITAPTRFDAMTSQRHFTIVCSEYVAMTLMGRFSAVAASEAPLLTFSLMGPDQRSISMFQRGDVDLLITMAQHFQANHPQKSLVEDDTVAVCWSGNTFIGSELDVETFLRLGHVVAALDNASSPLPYERMLTTQGLSRRIEVSVQSFSVVPTVLVGTQRVAVMHRRHAELFAQFLPLRLLPMPFQLTTATEIAQWHRLRDGEEGLDWLVACLTRLASDLN